MKDNNTICQVITASRAKATTVGRTPVAFPIRKPTIFEIINAFITYLSLKSTFEAAAFSCVSRIDYVKELVALSATSSKNWQNMPENLLCRNFRRYSVCFNITVFCGMRSS